MTTNIHGIRHNEGFLDTIKEYATEYYDTRGRKVVQTSIAPKVSRALQSFAQEHTAQLINSLLSTLPDEQGMIELGDQIANALIQAIHSSVLPGLYGVDGQVSESASEGAEKTTGINERLTEMYSSFISKLPRNLNFKVAGVDLSLQLQKLVQSSIPLSRFKEVYQRIEPLTQHVQEKVVPVAEGKVKNLAGFAFVSGVFVGGIIMFGYIKLYQSIDN